MSLQDWGAFGEVLGAIAVFLSLIYLALQIRQNTRTVAANTIQNLSESYREMNITLATDPMITPLMIKEANSELLNEEEEFRVLRFQLVIWRGLESIYFQKERGMLDKRYLDTRSKGVVGMLTKRGYERWSKNKEGFAKNFVEYVERLYESVSVETDP
jgi:hypothetical protein